MICSCEPDSSPNAKITVFTITRDVVAIGILDIFIRIT
jgi:hypothetical protein